MGVCPGYMDTRALAQKSYCNMYVRLVKLGSPFNYVMFRTKKKTKTGCRSPRGLVVKRRNVLDMGRWGEGFLAQQVMSLGPPPLETLSVLRQFIFLINVVWYFFVDFREGSFMDVTTRSYETRNKGFSSSTA